MAARDAAYGSLYHFFPEGNEELGVATLRAGGVTCRELAEAFFRGRRCGQCHPDLLRGAAVVEMTGFADACPIATVALEVASTSEPMEAAAEAFGSWLDVLEPELRRGGHAIDACVRGGSHVLRCHRRRVPAQSDRAKVGADPHRAAARLVAADPAIGERQSACRGGIAVTSPGWLGALLQRQADPEAD
ncbi:MAG: hypothetical protein M3083_01635 [Actinomycetota bacterium]|nr:hypothetical protein [Actinomycetota bacterium]